MLAEDGETIVLTGGARDLLGIEKCTLVEIPDLLRPHLAPPPPIHLKHTIQFVSIRLFLGIRHHLTLPRLAGEVNETWYEVNVDVPQPLPHFNESPFATEIDNLDRKARRYAFVSLGVI